MMPPRIPRPRLAALVLLLLCSLLFTVGCEGLPTVAQIRDIAAGVQKDVDAAQAVLDQAQPAIDAYRAEVEAMPDGDEKEAAEQILAAMEATLVKPREVVAKGSAVLAEINTRLAGLQDGDLVDVAEIGIDVGASTLPPPWGALVGLGGGLAIGLFRAYQNRQTARNIAKSVDHIIKGVEPSESTAIAARQTLAAERVVDEAQGKAVRLPF